MMKKIFAFVVTMPLVAAFAAVDVNQASEAELDGVKGIGPSLSGLILKARQQGLFNDWQDLMQRVKGISSQRAANLSQAGLSVNGAPYAPAAGKSQPQHISNPEPIREK